MVNVGIFSLVIKGDRFQEIVQSVPWLRWKKCDKISFLVIFQVHSFKLQQLIRIAK